MVRDIRAWLSVVFLGLSKIPLKIIAPLAYFFIKDKVNHRVFGVRDATDLSWYNIGIRNSVHNLFNRRDVPHETFPVSISDPTLEREAGTQWRYRRSLDRKYVSFRVTWGEPRSKGKREFYVGWTMGQFNLKGEPRMRLTFFQFRPW